MTDEQYQTEDERLREVLKDALERGDYYLELDVKELIVKNRDNYYNSGE